MTSTTRDSIQAPGFQVVAANASEQATGIGEAAAPTLQGMVVSTDRGTLASDQVLLTSQAGETFLLFLKDITVFLPSAAANIVGQAYHIAVIGNQNTFTLAPNNGDSISLINTTVNNTSPTTAPTSGSAAYLANATQGNFIVVVCASASSWNVTDMHGTWAKNP